MPTDKEWYIEHLGACFGPFSIKELKEDRRITPDTLVWKKGLPNWVAIRLVPELKEVFTDEKNPNKDPQESDEDVDENQKKLKFTKEEIALNLRYDPPQLGAWLLILLIVLFYIIYKLSQL